MIALELSISARALRTPSRGCENGTTRCPVGPALITPHPDRSRALEAA